MNESSILRVKTLDRIPIFGVFSKLGDDNVVGPALSAPASFFGL